MIPHYRLFLYFFPIIVFGFFDIAYSNDPENISSTAIVRSQLQSMAEEAVEKFEFNPHSNIAVFVDGEEPRSLAENAFIDVLKNKNYTAILTSEKKNYQSLQISILNVSVKIRQLAEKLSERTVQTVIEVKAKKENDGAVVMLGTFQRQTRDTAETFVSPQIGFFGGNEEESVIQRILTPFIVIGGIITIIYLLFTVRS